jgi:hypothetical protein
MELNNYERVEQRAFVKDFFREDFEVFSDDLAFPPQA